MALIPLGNYTQNGSPNPKEVQVWKLRLLGRERGDSDLLPAQTENELQEEKK